MSIIALLHNLLKEKLPSIHATRLQALMAAVEAGLKGASVSITELGRTLSGPAYIKHKIMSMAIKNRLYMAAKLNCPSQE